MSPLISAGNYCINFESTKVSLETSLSNLYEVLSLLFYTKKSIEI